MCHKIQTVFSLLKEFKSPLERPCPALLVPDIPNHLSSKKNHLAVRVESEMIAVLLPVLVLNILTPMIRQVKIVTARVNAERWTLAPKWFLRWIRKRLWLCSVSFYKRPVNLISELEISKQRRGSQSKSLRTRKLCINKWHRIKPTYLLPVQEVLVTVEKPPISMTCGMTSKLKCQLPGNL